MDQRGRPNGVSVRGNKVRNFDFMIADALGREADIAMAAARKLRIEVVFVIYGGKSNRCEGNILLEHLLGAEIRFLHASEDKALSAMEEVADELRMKERNPYVVPLGLASLLGAVAYEILAQASRRSVHFDHTVHTARLGVTQAGLTLGLKEWLFKPSFSSKALMGEWSFKYEVYGRRLKEGVHPRGEAYPNE